MSSLVAPLVAPHHPVLRLMRVRRERADRPGSRQDDHRLGLAIQGGGMRGVVSAAMLVALHDQGYGDVFDAVYGSSSGALNAAYFLDGAGPWRRLGIYWDHLTDRRFIDPRRWLRGGDLLDLDYAFGTVMRDLEPLDVRALLRSGPALHVAITLVDRLRSTTVSDFDEPDELLAALRASAWLPLGVRGTTSFRGERALDGAMLTVLPFHFALADGCTHVLSLSTRPNGPLRQGFGLGGALLRPRLNRIAPGLGAAHRRAAARYRQDRQEFARTNLDPPRRPPYLLDAAPLDWMPQLSAFEQAPGRLILAARQAYQVMASVLDGRAAQDLTRTRLRFVPEPDERSNEPSSWQPYGQPDGQPDGQPNGQPDGQPNGQRYARPDGRSGETTDGARAGAESPTGQGDRDTTREG